MTTHRLRTSQLIPTQIVLHHISVQVSNILRKHLYFKKNIVTPSTLHKSHLLVYSKEKIKWKILTLFWHIFFPFKEKPIQPLNYCNQKEILHFMEREFCLSKCQYEEGAFSFYCTLNLSTEITELTETLCLTLYLMKKAKLFEDILRIAICRASPSSSFSDSCLLLSLFIYFPTEFFLTTLSRGLEFERSPFQAIKSIWWCKSLISICCFYRSAPCPEHK